jgi:hypothetical protein
MIKGAFVFNSGFSSHDRGQQISRQMSITQSLSLTPYAS